MRQSCFFEKINKKDKPLSKLTKRQRWNMQINKIRNEKRNIITDCENTENPQIILEKSVLYKIDKFIGNG